MKKMFKEHELFKIVGLVMLFTLLLTWIIPSGSFSGTELVENGLVRVGLYDFLSVELYSINYFILQVLFLVNIGAFYGILSHIKSYQALVERVAAWVKNQPYVFVLVVTFVFAALASISTDVFQLLIFIPFIVSIILKAGMNKITAFSATFGGILIGIIGATYSTLQLEYLNQFLGTDYSTLIVIKLVIFGIAYVLFNVFNINHISATLAKKGKNAEINDPFAIETVKSEKKDKTKVFPVVIVFAVIFIFQVLAYIGWNDVFEITVFSEFHTWLMGLKIGDYTVVSYILGKFTAFGSWDLFSIQAILLLAIIALKFIGKIPFDEALNYIGEGIKKMLKPILFVILVNGVFLIGYWGSIVPTISNWILSITDGFNVYATALVGIVSSIFNVDFAFTGYSLGAFFAESFPDFNEVIMLVLKSTHGLVQFIAPTSIFLIVGLSYLSISYKDWAKYIWKFLVGMLAVLLIIYTMLVYVF